VEGVDYAAPASGMWQVAFNPGQKQYKPTFTPLKTATSGRTIFLELLQAKASMGATVTTWYEHSFITLTIQ
jgi:hypothetical protein